MKILVIVEVATMQFFFFLPFFPFFIVFSIFFTVGFRIGKAPGNLFNGEGADHTPCKRNTKKKCVNYTR